MSSILRICTEEKRKRKWLPLKEECLQIAFALVLACVNINKRQKATVRIIKYRLNKVVIRIDWTKSLKPLQCSYISFSAPFQTKYRLVWKSNTQKMRRIFQTNSSLVWKKNWFCKTQIPNQIQIGLEILMTIVKVLKIPNQIQFGLEKSLFEYSVGYRSVGWSSHTFRWTSLHCSEVSVVHSCPEDSKHSSFISVEHSSEYSVAHSCIISSWQTSRSTLLQLNI